MVDEEKEIGRDHLDEDEGAGVKRGKGDGGVIVTGE